MTTTKILPNNKVHILILYMHKLVDGKASLIGVIFFDIIQFYGEQE